MSCGGNNNTEQKLGNENDPETIPFDTIVIDYDLKNKLAEEKNSLYEHLALSEIIDSLKSISFLPGIQELNEKGLPFADPKKRPKYYSYNIPRPVYKRIFPSEEIKIEKMRFTSAKVDEKERKVFIRKGPKVTEERYYKSLLSLVEKEGYLQLLITKDGKYDPEIEMITVSKKDLKQIDKLSLYGGIYDSYDIDYWHSKIKDNFDELTLTRVKNMEMYKVVLDTSIIKYKIRAQGNIIKSK